MVHDIPESVRKKERRRSSHACPGESERSHRRCRWSAQRRQAAIKRNDKDAIEFDYSVISSVKIAASAPRHLRQDPGHVCSEGSRRRERGGLKWYGSGEGNNKTTSNEHIRQTRWCEYYKEITVSIFPNSVLEEKDKMQFVSSEKESGYFLCVSMFFRKAYEKNE